MATSITFNNALDMSTLQDRSVLVTGAAAGIGLAIAAKLAEIGAWVTISDIQDQVGQAAATNLVAKGYRVQFVHCDVKSYQAQVNAFKRAIEFGEGHLDIVIPNAGVMAEKNLFDMVPAEAPTMDSPPPPEPSFLGVDVNLHAAYNTCYLAMHYFRLPRNTTAVFKPNIILISSLAGYVGYPSSTTYSTSKFCVRGLFYGIRDRAVRSSPPVRVNLVAPWYIDTAMTQTPEFLQSEASLLLNVMGYVPMERVVDPVLRFCVDDKLHGRAAGIFPACDEDIGDDLEGGYGGKVLSKHMADVMVKAVSYMAEQQVNALDRQDSAATG
ncbi:NAD(P)-binding protein [Plenodomus tracheiphilus IPT5]|uniref:NAD(P)-binding protein n=1 Tax=Plenodomus tracheiphilus IPT5 TaxID=1408161 RepID=A0A6A7ATT6_9PLEO|nr:NAD(P)-binding protein [Plenodomus tracheiphilus IPT5]